MRSLCISIISVQDKKKRAPVRGPGVKGITRDHDELEFLKEMVNELSMCNKEEQIKRTF
ncbi:hypothetical protein HAX54_040039 [Datura stramonium]|uniref:Uncharacterized protein n=1 Tax=Datura stramonium TaxID=4076 RepID=A0ABS8SK03_DATST|nr:hypothetical protein [Datura stramonium]